MSGVCGTQLLTKLFIQSILGNKMASRKRIYTSKTLKVLDVTCLNSANTIGLLNMLKENLDRYLGNNDMGQDVQSVMRVITDLTFEINETCEELAKEEPIYADTLEEYLAEEKAEQENN